MEETMVGARTKHENERSCLPRENVPVARSRRPSASAASRVASARCARLRLAMSRWALHSGRKAALAVVAAMLVVVSPAPAQAQTAIDFVSNIGEASLTTGQFIGVTGTSRHSAAQSFRTGAVMGGYTLTSVVADLGFVPPGARLRVSIYSASGGNPGASLHELTIPASPGGQTVFTAPANAQLAANTDYFVVFENTASLTIHSYRVKLTNSDNQTGQSGWSIADTLRHRNANNASWSSAADSLKIAIKGRITNNSAPTGRPTISGPPQVGETLTADTSQIRDADGLSGATFSYQWLRFDGTTETRIRNATSNTYVATAADLGKDVKVVVSFTDDVGTPETLTSEEYPLDGTIVAAKAACPADADWCGELTVEFRGAPLTGVDKGFGSGYGALTNEVFTVGGAWYDVDKIVIDEAGDDFEMDFSATAPYVRPPYGTIVTVHGTSFTMSETSRNPGRTGFNFTWTDYPTWLQQQKATVSLNFPPQLTSARVAGSSLYLTYHEPLDERSVPARTAFTVTVDGGAGVSPSDVSVSGSTVTLTLAAAVTAGQAVEVSYAAPTTDPVRDESGIAADGFADRAVAHDAAVPDTAGPEAVLVAAGGNRVSLTYDEPLDRNSVPAASAYAVTANGAGRTVSDVSVSGSVVTLTLASLLAIGESVRVIYTKPAANPVQDLVGNDAADLDRSVTAALFATLSAEDYSFDANSRMHYRFNLVLTEAVAIGFKHMRDRAFRVNNGTMVRAKRVDKATRSGKVVASRWSLTVRAHTRSKPVTVSLPANRPCTRRGALCTLGGVRLANAPSLTLSTASVDGNAAPTLSIANASAPENVAALNFTITLSSPLRSAVEVHFETLDDDSDTTATAGTDYWATSQTILIPAGNRTWDMGVRLVEDEDDDAGETVAVRISNARAIEHDGRPIVPLGITDAEATGTITAPLTATTNIPGATMWISDTEADESDGWLRFDVTLNQAHDEYVCYDFETLTTGTATEEVDYALRPKTTLWLSPGQVQDRPFVRILRDSMTDPNETVKVKISNARLCDNPSGPSGSREAKRRGRSRTTARYPGRGWAGLGVPWGRTSPMPSATGCGGPRRPRPT